MDQMDESRVVWAFDWTPPAQAAAMPEIDLERVAAGFAEFAAAMNTAMQQLAEAWIPATAAIRDFHSQLVEAGLVPDQPPSDPKARALHLRRHRNTGPAPRALGRR